MAHAAHHVVHVPSPGMPTAVAPWPDARVQGEARSEARSEDEAVRMILIAMERSEGWQVPLPGSHSVDR